MIHHVARGLVCALLERIESGQLTLVENGIRRVFGSGSPQATVVIRDPRAFIALRRGGKGLAESYVDGWWDSPDVTAVIEVAARNLDGIDAFRRRITPVREPYQRAKTFLRRNTPVRSREDIAAHYDLGNDLFELMLDETMMYSSAIFERRDMTLADASRAKLERICEKLDLQPSDHVLEIGTGWGGFALHAAQTRGCRVTTTTLSREQRDLALERVREAGMEDRVTVLLDDYRELEGTYDKLVSIEMIEAVGWKDFGTFFDRCAGLLRPDGVMGLQAITIDDRLYEVEKAQRSFMNSLIFPNGCLPSVEVIARSVARKSDLRMVDLEDITPHYAETLRRWRANVEAHTARLADMGYDDRFQRLWRLYLSFCEAGFTERRIGSVQIVLAKPRWRGRLDTAEALTAPSMVASL
ncbi:cyclopropane-fatty-acyl-phospholipid synthase family protein [Solirubrobacter ginsenosidimutans]|uniref:Cyclopropane-fatty-acyl-phospholipid synthase family protein n=1 Tax=Solirubrobacter ginsenosidimutans TaxID=490573 RepID=A0A9X3MNX7_9ACTN|nr:cyclopropane-fatty-acyl-phospholipid synthase family protein [Solirubrobacter ginsenosidimutans]MDA0159687.1 cyclopropane-fatty-acyl-phospholipid synthase family protein [Solirubrobacter ginsenosidimutans]